MKEYTLMGVVSVTWRFLTFAPKQIFRIGEARHFKYCVLIDTDDY